VRDIELHRREVEETVAFLNSRLHEKPEIVIVLGTGLSRLADSVADPVVIPYADIPYFPVSSVTSHTGNLVAGKLSGRNVVILQGRVHCYEGFSAREVAFSIRVMSRLGTGTAIVTNASGGLNPAYAPGTIMILSDHINLLGDNPLRGPNIDEWGPRFPDLSVPYDTGLISTAVNAARELNLENVRTGTYVCIPGPSLETPAETRFLRKCGADAVGMSSLPEILVAVHGGMNVLGLSVVANVNDPDNLRPIILEDIIEAAQRTEPVLQKLISAIIKGCEA
jgi:purine-nucleoside phosphorylase